MTEFFFSQILMKNYFFSFLTGPIDKSFFYSSCSLGMIMIIFQKFWARNKHQILLKKVLKKVGQPEFRDPFPLQNGHNNGHFEEIFWKVSLEWPIFSFLPSCTGSDYRIGSLLFRNRIHNVKKIILQYLGTWP